MDVEIHADRVVDIEGVAVSDAQRIEIPALPVLRCSWIDALAVRMIPDATPGLRRYRRT